MHTSKGAFALLVGSGVSRAAQIPTGWEIVLDLIQKLAHLEGCDCGPDPFAWYLSSHAEEPNYSTLLATIAKSREERQRLLRGYFEPNDDEREQGIKQPTAAHRAIAKLVADGFVRVIVTTNFDRLIERAIEDVGVVPTVLSTTDAITGALPLVHQRCCIVKLHGDYLDTRIRNTPAELAKYTMRANRLLDRILDEFGIVVCGWSATWDPALCGAFARCKSRRFSLYWSSRESLSPAARRIVDNRDATVVTIKDADTFFTELAEKVTALSDLDQPHPISIAAAVATAKRLVTKDEWAVRLFDFVQAETEATFMSLQPIFGTFHERGNQQETIRKAVDAFSTKTELLRAVSVVLAQWGRETHQSAIARALERIATDPREGQSGTHIDHSLRAIPSVLVLYVAGITALSQANYGMLAAILSGPRLYRREKRKPLLAAIAWHDIQGFFKSIEGHNRSYFPASEWLLKDCRRFLLQLLPSDLDYERTFDQFEIIRSIVYGDLDSGTEYSEQTEELAGPPGRFVWTIVNDGVRNQGTIIDEVRKNDALAEQLAKFGLFGRDPDRFRLAARKFEPCVARFMRNLH